MQIEVSNLFLLTCKTEKNSKRKLIWPSFESLDVGAYCIKTCTRSSEIELNYFCLKSEKFERWNSIISKFACVVIRPLALRFMVLFCIFSIWFQFNHGMSVYAKNIFSFLWSLRDKHLKLFSLFRVHPLSLWAHIKEKESEAYNKRKRT